MLPSKIFSSASFCDSILKALDIETTVQFMKIELIIPFPSNQHMTAYVSTINELSLTMYIYCKSKGKFRNLIIFTGNTPLPSLYLNSSLPTTNQAKTRGKMNTDLPLASEEPLLILCHRQMHLLLDGILFDTNSC